MESALDRKTLWNEGARAGLIFGAIAIAYMVINSFTGKLGADGSPLLAGLISVLNLALWAGKFLGCIFLMRGLMRKLCEANPDALNGDTFLFGVITALLSALLYSAFYLAFVLFIQPDMLTNAYDTVLSSYSSMLDSNTMEQMENLRGSLPQMTFFTNLFWCVLYGTVLSAILSRNIPSRNPFAKEDD